MATWRNGIGGRRLDRTLMRVVLVHNIKSGAEYELEQLMGIFKHHSVMVEESFTISQLKDKRYVAHLKRGATVATVGGDGTINAVAYTLLGTPARLLPLPGGTFNHFVRDIGSPLSLELALENLTVAREQMVDVAYVNDRLFLNNSNLGLYPFSLHERKVLKKYTGKYIAAVVSAFDQFSRFKRRQLIIDGIRVRSPFVFIGNGKYDIAANLIPARHDMASSTLTVMLSSATSRRGLVAGLAAVIKGDTSSRRDFSVEYRSSLTIESSHKSLSVSLDGEVIKLSPPLQYRVEPKAIKVLAIPAE